MVLLKERQSLVDRSADLLAGTVTGRVVRQSCPQALGDADVVDDQSTRLVSEGAVNPGDGLHQPAPRIGLSTYIVCSDGESKPVSHMSRTITSSSGSSGPWPVSSGRCRSLLRMCLLQLGTVGGRAGDDDLDRPSGIVVRMPVRAELDDLVVQARRRSAGTCRRSGPCRPSAAAASPSAQRCPERARRPASPPRRWPRRRAQRVFSRSRVSVLGDFGDIVELLRRVSLATSSGSSTRASRAS